MRMAGTVIDPAVVASLAQGATGDEKLAAAQIANADLENTAGIIHDISTGASVGKNDGNPRSVITDGNRTTVFRDEGAAYPVKTQTGQREAYGSTMGQQLSGSEREAFANYLHAPGTRTIEGTGDSIRNRENPGQYYNRVMPRTHSMGMYQIQT